MSIYIRKLFTKKKIIFENNYKYKPNIYNYKYNYKCFNKNLVFTPNL